MKTRLKIAFAALILMAPAAGFAATPRAAGSTTHMRPVVFRDRTPKAHVHTVSPHR